MEAEDLIKFFKVKMTIENNFRDMTEEGFNCFKTLFLIINEKLNKIKKLSALTGAVQRSSF